jgi:hypothetical protein
LALVHVLQSPLAAPPELLLVPPLLAEPPVPVVPPVVPSQALVALSKQPKSASQVPLTHA